MHLGVKEKSGTYYGIFHYHQALQRSDYIVGRLWDMLQADSFYEDSTYLIVSTDHGRDNVPSPDQWWDHGVCREHGGGLCSGCQSVFALVVGPGVKARVVGKRYTHLDLAPTIAKILGVELPTALGTPMDEVFH